MEFLRMGSQIPGKYWGCCAVDIIQHFDHSPDEKASIQLVSGDSGTALLNKQGKALYLGPTYKDIFINRMRIGTFGSKDMPNHIFMAAMTDQQLGRGNGLKWLKLMHEYGFKHVGSCDNSVYSGSNPDASAKSSHKIHIFALFRNIGNAALDDPFAEPSQFKNLGNVKKSQREMWDSTSTVFMTEDELRAAGAPVTASGVKGKIPTVVTPGTEVSIKDGWCEEDDDDDYDDHDPFDFNDDIEASTVTYEPLQ